MRRLNIDDFFFIVDFYCRRSSFSKGNEHPSQFQSKNLFLIFGGSLAVGRGCGGVTWSLVMTTTGFIMSLLTRDATEI